MGQGTTATRRIAVITGGARGMGAVTARALAAQGWQLFIADWEGEAGQRLAADINREHGNNTLYYRFCDLSDPDSVTQFAEFIRQQAHHVDVLINNAGITWPERRFNRHGQEMHFAICHLGHFLLTQQLLPMLYKAPAARILVVSSDGHRAAPAVNFDDLSNAAAWGGKAVSHSAAFRAYSHAKLCNLLFMRELHERLADTAITVNAISPGYFVNTGIHREMRGIFKLGSALVFGLGSLFGLNTAEKGARTHIWLASSSDAEGISGRYFQACKERETSAAARDEAAQKKLWQVSENLLADWLAGGA